MKWLALPNRSCIEAVFGNLQCATKVDLPADVDPYDDRVYARARENLRRMVAEGHMAHDPRPAYYVYRLTMDGHVQTGILGAAAVEGMAGEWRGSVDAWFEATLGWAHVVIWAGRLAGHGKQAAKKNHIHHDRRHKGRRFPYPGI